MSLFNTPPSYAGANTASPFVGGIRSIGSMMAQMPYLRAMANQRQAMAQFQRSHAAYEDAARQEALARTGLIGEQTRGAQIKNDSAGADVANLQKFGSLTKAFVAAQQAFQGNPTPENKAALESATADMSGGAASLKDMKVGDLATAIGKLRAQNMLAGQNPDFRVAGGYQGGAAQIANEDTRAAQAGSRPMIVPTGGTMMTPQGEVLGQGGVTLQPGQQRFAPVGQDGLDAASGLQRIAQGAPLPPKASATDTARAQLAGAILKQQVQNGSNTNSVPAVLSQFDQAVAPRASQPPQAPVQGVAPAGGGATQSVPAGAIAKLRANPQLRGDFEAKYGVSANLFLNQ